MADKKPLVVGTGNAVLQNILDEDTLLAPRIRLPDNRSLQFGVGSNTRMTGYHGGTSGITIEVQALAGGYRPSLVLTSEISSGYFNLQASNSDTGRLTGTSAGQLTWASNTIWHAGNDGAGSGLDADLLDGQHGSYYQPSSTALNDLALGSGNISFSNASVFRRTYTLPNVNATILTDANTVTVPQGGTGLTSLTTGNYLRAASPTTLQQRTPAQVRADIGAGTGTVSSVALSPPTGMTVTGSPVTGSGTLNLTWVGGAPNRFLGTPTAGLGAPSFRAIEAVDLPWLGTAATYDVPASGDATSNQVVLGNDSRLHLLPTGANTEVLFNISGHVGSTPDMTFDGILFKAPSAQARLAEQTFNANTTLTNLTVPNTNRVIKKTATGNNTYTLTTSLGADGDTLTFVNASSFGNIILQGSGVTLYVNGAVVSTFVIGPRKLHTFYRLASNQWIG